jgi:hypothetical protein
MVEEAGGKRRRQEASMGVAEKVEERQKVSIY